MMLLSNYFPLTSIGNSPNKEIGTPDINNDISEEDLMLGTNDYTESLNSFSGDGSQLTSELICELQGIKQNNISVNSTFQVPGREWNYSSVVINVSNILSNFSTTGEMDFLTSERTNLGYQTYSFGYYYYYQPFIIPNNDCYLTNLSVYMLVDHLHSGGNDLGLKILNAQNPGNIQPYNVIYTGEFDLGSGSISENMWLFLNLSTPLNLKSSETVQNTYYVCFYEIFSDSDFEWFGASDIAGPSGDGVDEFKVWQWYRGSWSVPSLDLSLNTTIIASANASDIDLKINGTSVTETGPSNGTWSKILSEPTNESLYFNVTSNRSTLINIEPIFNLSKIQYFNSSFGVSSESEYSNWNATQNITFYPASYDYKINLTLPLWNIENVSFNDANHTNTQLNLNPNNQILLINDAQNGTWNIVCNSTNFLENVSTIKNDIFVSAVNVTDTVNFSCNFSKNLLNGQANLTVYPTTKGNFTASKMITGSDSIVFDE